jgi:hypothetical protein
MTPPKQAFRPLLSSNHPLQFTTAPMTHRHRPFPRKVLSSSAPSQTLHSDRPPTSISFTNGASTAPFLKHRRPRLPQFKSPGSALPLNSPARQRSLHKWRHHDALLGVTSQRHLPRTGGCQSLDPNRPGALPFTTGAAHFTATSQPPLLFKCTRQPVCRSAAAPCAALTAQLLAPAKCTPRSRLLPPAPAAPRSCR